MIRFVPWAGEFISVVRLKALTPGVEGKPTLSITWIVMKREGRGLKGPVITGMTLETE